MIEFHSFSTVDNHLCLADDSLISIIRFRWEISECTEQYLQFDIYRLRCFFTAFHTVGFYVVAAPGFFSRSGAALLIPPQ